MPDAAQYTLGLFDTTAIGWTVDLPTSTSAPASPPEHDEPDATDPIGHDQPQPRGINVYLDGGRQLARGWAARARDNIAAIRLSKKLADSGRAPTREE